jgi:hypothetical protein
MPIAPLAVGCWHLTYADPVLEMNEPLELEFRPSGELIYSVDAGGKWQMVRLTFRIDGDVLITDQPSDPREERTPFTLRDLYTLVLDYDGARAFFSRGDKRAPAI